MTLPSSSSSLTLALTAGLPSEVFTLTAQRVVGSRLKLGNLIVPALTRFEKKPQLSLSFHSPAVS